MFVPVGVPFTLCGLKKILIEFKQFLCLVIKSCHSTLKFKEITKN